LAEVAIFILSLEVVLFDKHNLNDEVRDDETVRAIGLHVGFLWESQKERDH
jgi:hypothetical protein